MNVEYVSAYPTGDLSDGDISAAVSGERISRLFEMLGWNVTREFYVNDTGPQTDVMVRAAQARLGQQSFEPNPFLDGLAKAVNDTFDTTLFERTEDAWFETLRSFCVSWALDRARGVLAAKGLAFDEFRCDSEIDLTSLQSEVLETFRSQDLIDQDTSSNAGEIKLTSTKLGDSVDRVLRTADGRNTYLFGDACYHADKFNRGFDGISVLLRQDHAAYVTPLNIMINALNPGAKGHVRLRVLGGEIKNVPELDFQSLDEALARWPKEVKTATNELQTQGLQVYRRALQRCIESNNSPASQTDGQEILKILNQILDVT